MEIDKLFLQGSKMKRTHESISYDINASQIDH